MAEEQKIPDVFMPNEGKPPQTRNGTYAENLILEGLSKGITDPKKLKELAGIRKSADLFITMDRLALRKEFHQALAANGLSLEQVVANIARIANDRSVLANESVILKANMGILKALSLDKYETSSISDKTWEDLVLEKAAKEQELRKSLPNGRIQYAVEMPEVPEDMKEINDRTIAEGKSLVEGK